MKATMDFIKELFEDMEGTAHWCIVGMEGFNEVTKDDVVCAMLSDGSLYEKQDNIYIHQTSGYCEDNYSGTIIKPITEKVALVVSYEC